MARASAAASLNGSTSRAEGTGLQSPSCARIPSYTRDWDGMGWEVDECVLSTAGDPPLFTQDVKSTFAGVLVSLGCWNRIPLTGGLKQHTFISLSSGGWKFKRKVLADGSLVRALALACRRPPSHRVRAWWAEKELRSLFLFV